MVAASMRVPQHIREGRSQHAKASDAPAGGGRALKFALRRRSIVSIPAADNDNVSESGRPLAPLDTGMLCDRVTVRDLPKRRPASRQRVGSLVDVPVDGVLRLATKFH